ncbi:hypothetical protein [Mycetohabitans endofungorum]|uniref:hypothetical protein n=1 Tax=Mycetohabitans endofungorum TaxID=417203 RepID=UPI002B053E03|nr:hypothetical protein [Mycetohabitans endofungorum]
MSITFLQLRVAHDYSGITRLVAASVQRALDAYLDVLGPHEDHRPDDEPPSPGFGYKGENRIGNARYAHD